ncbi:uncharacterized protein LOC141720752 [Apium graveolens]|uniref:uncharacterized protein LOC141720752 n=1 Tax=Apium graveolens TaxID=4045 RepID=UPI003D78BDFA
MASQATTKRERGMGRGPNHVPKAPANPEDRTLIHIRPPPNTTYVFLSRIKKLLHNAVRESESQGPVNWVDVYVKTRDGIPEVVTIAGDYQRLFDEGYSEGTERPYFDQELWDKAAKVKKNYVKGQGQRRRSFIYGSSFSTQSSSQPSIHTPTDCVRAICRDPGLLRILGGHLGALDPEELARAVAEVNASQQRDDSEGAHRDDHDDEFGGSS